MTTLIHAHWKDAAVPVTGSVVQFPVAVDATLADSLKEGGEFVCWDN